MPINSTSNESFHPSLSIENDTHLQAPQKSSASLRNTLGWLRTAAPLLITSVMMEVTEAGTTSGKRTGREQVCTQVPGLLCHVAAQAHELCIETFTMLAETWNTTDINPASLCSQNSEALKSYAVAAHNELLNYCSDQTDLGECSADYSTSAAVGVSPNQLLTIGIPVALSAYYLYQNIKG
ncbi:MAG: hypothetical protein ACI9S8_002767 [Chlamydiales bacterium]|jgi:hypothetical protein